MLVWHVKTGSGCKAAYDGQKIHPSPAGLAASCKGLSRKEGLLITLDEEKEITADGVKINVLPAWKFPLQ